MWKRVVLLALCLVFPSLMVMSGQVNKSNLTGVIRDATRAVIGGASVKLANLATGATRETTADESGLYRFTLVDSGYYRLEVQSPGFKTFIQESIQLETGETARLDVELELGDVTESVTVTSEAPLLKSETAVVGSTVSEQVIQELPLIGRNPYVFLTLNPGIQYYGDAGALNPWDNFGVSDFSGGGSEGRSEFLLDGMPNMRIDLVGFSPSPDAVSEMNVQTNAYDAEYGHSNASFVNVSTKSGSNEIHGSTYWYLRNDNLNANSFFNNRNGNTKSESKQNTYGVSVGGPIIRDKTHYYVTYEGTQVRGAGFVRAIVPTELERVGDFSQTQNVRGDAYTIYDPATTKASADGSGFVRNAFPNNIVPVQRQDPVALKSMEYYPHPNLARLPDNLENFENPRPGGRHWASLATRGDHQLTNSHSLFMRFGWNHRTDPAGPYYGDCCGPAGNPTNGQDEFQRGNIAAGVGDTWLASPKTVVDFRLGFTRYFDANVMRGEGFDISQLGFPSSLAQSVVFQTFPRYEMSGDVENLGAGRTTARNFINQYNPLINVHSQYGRHAVKYGFRFQVAQSNNFAPNRSGGYYKFDRVFTRGPDPTRTTTTGGHDTASFLLGAPSSGYVDIRASRAVQNRYWSFYVQDDWKTSNRLTMNLGVRFEHEEGTTERYNQGNAGFDFNAVSPVDAQAAANYAQNPIPELAELNARGGLLFLATDGIGRQHLATEPLLVAPRFGLAYRITDRMVWRMGYGIYYAPNNIDNFRQDGFSLATRMLTSLDGNLTPFHTLSDPFPNGLTAPPGASGGLLTGVGQAVTSAAVGSDGVPDFRHGLTQQFSAGFQAILPGEISFEANYVGNVAQRLTISRDLNAYPNADLALQTRLNAKVDNPFFGVIDDPTSLLSQPTTTVAQLLRPYPHFVGENGVVDTVLPLGRSHYDSVQMQASKRMNNGFQFGTSYTISKLLEATTYLNPNDTRPENVISNADRPQRFVAYGIWELPFGPGKPLLNSSNPVVRRLVGGWQFNWVVTYQSGPALAFPNAIRLARSESNPYTIEEYFDRSQFAPQEPFTLNTLSSRVADLRAPGLKKWDLTVMKKVKVTERVTMQFQGEFYNAWNTTHFAAPNTTVTSGNFGRITGTSLGPRNIQLSARVLF